MMTKREWRLWGTVTAALIPLAIWAFLPGFIFHPYSLQYKKIDGEWQGFFHRETLGPVRLTFVQVMRPATLPGELPPPSCTHPAGARDPVIHHSAETGPVISFRAPANVVPCLESNRPIVGTVIYTVRLGPFSLRPITTTNIHQ